MLLKYCNYYSVHLIRAFLLLASLLVSFLQQKEKPADVKNPSYTEDEEQVQQSVCLKSRVLTPVTAETNGLEPDPPVSTHEVKQILVFQVALVRVIGFLLQRAPAEVVL